MKLRQWQSECVDIALSNFKQKQTHFFCLACPAAGKTVMASTLAARLLNEGLIDFVFCFSPSLAVTAGFQEVLENTTGRRMDGGLGASGAAYTYHRMSSLDEKFWDLFKTYRIFTIFDEIHHAGGASMQNANRWGEQILAKIKSETAYSVELSGTPWRTDSLPVTMANYHRQSGDLQLNYEYGLSRAVAEKVCCKPHFHVLDSGNIVLNDTSGTKCYRNLTNFFEIERYPISELLNNDVFTDELLQRAHKQLSLLRQESDSCAGLIVASSIDHAFRLQQKLQQKFSIDAPVVNHLASNSVRTINQFRNAKSPWVISIGMISEGTDIPRLRVCCYFSNVKTELYFRQVLGRIMRYQSSLPEHCHMYFPAIAPLVQFAKSIHNDIPNACSINIEHFMDPLNCDTQSEPILVAPGPLLAEGHESRHESATEFLIDKELFSNDSATSKSIKFGQFKEQLFSIILN